MISKNKKISKIINWIYYLCSFLIKKNKNTVVFMSYPDFSDNSLALYKYLKENRKELTLIWLATSPSKENIETYRNVLKKWSLSGILAFCSSATIFHTHGTYFFVNKKIKNQKIIALWHGMPLKKLGYLKGDSWPEVPFSDYSIATSEFFKPIIAGTFNIKMPNVVVSGLPRNDILSNPKLIDRNFLLSKLNLQSYNGFIVWLPTYRKSFIKGLTSDADYQSFLDEWSDDEWTEINDRLCAKGIKIVIKLHPADILNSIDIENKYSNIAVINSTQWQSVNIDLYSLLAISNGMITDVSSVLVDYLLTNKPLAMTGKSIQGYNRGLNEGIDIVKQAGVFNIKNITEFNEFIEICAAPHNVKLEQKTFGEYHTIGTQSACENLAQMFLCSKDE